MSPAVRMTLFNAIYFAGLSAALLFLPVWFEKARGLSGAEIGGILAVAGFGRMFAGPLVASWADGRADRHAAPKTLALVAVAAFAIMGIVRGFWPILLCAAVGVTVYWLVVGYVEAGLMRLCRGRLTYPVARGLGSAAFVAGSLILGEAIDLYGPGSAQWIVVALCVALAGSAFLLTPETATLAERGAPLGARLREGLDLVRNPAFFLLIFGAGFTQASHAFYNAFGALVWINENHISGAWVGRLYAIGVAVEVAFLVLLGDWAQRFRPETLVAAGGAGAVLRWLFLAQTPGLAWLVPMQALHALSFATTYLGTMRLIQRWYGDERTPTAQMMYQSFAAAPEAALATLFAGPLYDRFGAGGYYAMAGLAVVGIGLALALRRARPPQFAAA